MDLLSYGSLPVSRLKVDDLVASRAEPFAFGALALLVSWMRACMPPTASDGCDPMHASCTHPAQPLHTHAVPSVAPLTTLRR
jgi:hypothetical protein